MDLLDKFLEKIKKENMKDFVSKLGTILILGIALVVAYNTFVKKDSDDIYINNNLKTEQLINNSDLKEDYSSILERRLENILTNIKGVGKVAVMVTVEETYEKVPAKNTIKSSEKTKESDSEGGVREVIREDYNEQVVVNNNQLALIKQLKPTIKGVIVVAEGVDDIRVKEKLYTAVKTVLGIPGNRVEIYLSKEY